MKSISNILPLIAVASLSATSLFAQTVDEEPQPGQRAQPYEQPQPGRSSTNYEEIVITSSRIEQPLREVATAISVITRDELDLKGYSSLADALRTEASIGVTNAGGAGKDTALRIRGEEGYRTLVLIDGVDMSDPTGTQIGPQIQHIMNTLDIERVEILRGPQGFMYGADAGGVVNILTSEVHQGVAGKVSAEVAGQGARNIGLSVRGGNDRGNFSVSLSDHDSEGFNARSDDTELKDNDGASNTTAHMKGGLVISENLNTTLVLRDINAVFDFDNCGFGASDDCEGTSKQQLTKLSVDYRSGDFTNTLSYAITDVERDSFTEGVSTNYTEGSTKEVEYLGSYAVFDHQTFVYGADFEEDEITQEGNESDRDQLGIFAEYQYGLNDSLFLTAGLRRDDNSEFGVHTSYRISSAYIQDYADGRSVKYRATLGTGFRAPSLYEVAYNAGPYGNGVALKEDSSRGIDMGVDYVFANGAVLQFTYFDQVIKNEIFFDLINFSGYLQESGETTSRGVEIGAEYPISDHFSLSANYTFNDTDSNTDFTRSRRPEHLANLSLNATALDQKLVMLANVRIANDLYNDIFGIGLVRLDDYEVVDLSARYRIDDSMEIFGGIQNLLDEEYVEVTNFNTQSRTVRAGIRFSF